MEPKSHQPIDQEPLWAESDAVGLTKSVGSGGFVSGCARLAEMFP